jgi:3-dehydro-L-gulonate 2-dehydrogenase
MTIARTELVERIRELLLQRQVRVDKADLCASIIAESTADGVISHGIARLPRLLDQIDAGDIDPAAEPVKLDAPSAPAMEGYDGHRGIGISNAAFAADRAMALAGESGIGMVALRNTSHWLRAGSYGWRAVRRGFALICWTNTTANMPAWGADRPVIGNNPMVIAVPGVDGDDSLVVDMAMSQYSWGRIGETRRAGGQLEVAGGWDRNGELTRNPDEISESGLALPAGYWKGSALSMVLDLFAAAASGGSGHRGHSPEGNEYQPDIHRRSHGRPGTIRPERRTRAPGPVAGKQPPGRLASAAIPRRKQPGPPAAKR